MQLNVNHGRLSSLWKQGLEKRFIANWDICSATFDKTEINTYGMNLHINVLSQEIHLSL